MAASIAEDQDRPASSQGGSEVPQPGRGYALAAVRGGILAAGGLALASAPRIDVAVPNRSAVPHTCHTPGAFTVSGSKPTVDARCPPAHTPVLVTLV